MHAYGHVLLLVREADLVNFAIEKGRRHEVRPQQQLFGACCAKSKIHSKSMLRYNNVNLRGTEICACACGHVHVFALFLYVRVVHVCVRACVRMCVHCVEIFISYIV